MKEKSLSLEIFFFFPLEIFKNKRKLPKCAGKEGGVVWRQEKGQGGPWMGLNGCNPGFCGLETGDAGP